MTSQCPLPDQCGSCGWSHIPYKKQLEQKLSDINGSFKLKKLNIHCEEIIAADTTTHYRNRMDFVIDWQGAMGLREKGKWWRVIDNHPCFLADKKIEKLFFAVRDWVKTSGLTYFDRKANVGFLRYAVIRSTTLGQTMVNIVTSAPTSPTTERETLQKLADNLDATTVVWSINHTITDVSFGEELHTLKGPATIEENINGYRYRVSPNAFFQTNPHGAPLLMDTVRKYVGDASQKTVLDLYCGTGFFTMPLARVGKRIVGVELSSEAIADARANAKLNEITDIEFFDAATENFDWQRFCPDVVVVDPPRSGMHNKALEDLLAYAPTEIIYISCNPKNFAREMCQISEKYNAVAMCAIDMFPHTPHVELVTKLVRK